MSIILEFPKVSVLKTTNVKYSDKTVKEVTYKEAQDMLMAEWNERNEVISEQFCTMSVWQKQETLDVILQMNSDLYKIIIEMKGKVE